MSSSGTRAEKGNTIPANFKKEQNLATIEKLYWKITEKATNLGETWQNSRTKTVKSAATLC